MYGCTFNFVLFVYVNMCSVNCALLNTNVIVPDTHMLMTKHSLLQIIFSKFKHIDFVL